MRVLVCGSRDWTNIGMILSCIKSLQSEGYDTLIEGEARGADIIARDCAKYLGMNIVAFPANWEKYHKSAGMLRNKQMLDEGKPDLVVAFNNDISKSIGTKDMIYRARKANIPFLLLKENND